MLGICRYYCCVASAHCVHIIPYFIRHIFTEAPLIPSLAWQSSSGQRWWRHWLWEIVIRMTDAPISMFYFWPVKIIAERGWVRSARQQSDVSRDWEWLTETRRGEGYWGPGSPDQLLKLCRRGESGVMIMSSGAVMESSPGSVSIILIRENISWASGQKPAQSPLSSQVVFRLANFHFQSRNVSWKDTTTSRTNLLVLPTVSGLIFNSAVGSAQAGGCGKRSGVRKQNFKITSPG